ncbi:MAG: chemotaxis protein CheV [Gammaproteobacteria bacterium]|nr:chemotaxis protein CheV [Gammaproteobacteria bacterium]
MSSMMKSIDERTSLAGANRLEILLFSLGKDKHTGREEVFGLNVFKIREVIAMPPITHAPDMPPGVEGMVSLRGSMIPIINLAKFCDIETDSKPANLIVTEYNRSTHGLMVSSVEQIMRMEWSDIKVPPQMMAHRHGGLVTAVTELADKRIVMIIDVEKVLAETEGMGEDPTLFAGIDALEEPATVLFADDSVVARKQIAATLDHLGVRHIGTKNGEDAWKKLQELAERADASHIPMYEMINAILTDVEMPGMDGYVLTRKIKADKRFAGIPVIMHSSLSSDSNISIGTQVGADAYVPKFDPQELSKVLKTALKKDKKN